MIYIYRAVISSMSLFTSCHRATNQFSSLLRLVIVIVVGFIGAAVEGDDVLVQKFRVEDFDFNGVYQNRHFSLSTESPVLTEIRKNRTAERAVERALTLIQKMDDVVVQRVKNNDSEACNVIYVSRWTNGFRKLTPIWQIGSVEEQCNSRVDAELAVRNNELDPSVARNARKDIVDARSALFWAFQKASEGGGLLPNDGNWTSPEAPFKLLPTEQVKDGQRCLVDSTSAYFRDGNWYLRAGITNHQMQLFLPDWHRHLVVEFVPRSNVSSSMRMVHKRLSDSRLENSTTVLFLWKGRAFAGITEADDDFSDPIAPVSQAFRENLVVIDQASDSITISNIAILALPMIMNFIPVAFIADVTGIGAFLYILFTDILSTVPFLIKGIELIRWSAPRREIVVSFHAGDETLRLCEVWSVRCRGEDLFRTTGIAFIVVALVVLFVGLFLEICAKLYMTRRERAAKKDETVGGPFGGIIRNRPMFAIHNRSGKSAFNFRRKPSGS